jgi:hypothetical protein
MKQITKLLISLVIAVILTSCSSLDTLFQSRVEVEIEPARIEAFRNLIKEDWKIKVVDNRVVLFKIVGDRAYIMDIFNINKE